MITNNFENRKFGILLLIIYVLVAYIFNLNINSSIFNFSFIIIFLVIIIYFPNKLNYLRLKWIFFGNFLGKFISPLILSGLFFFIISPIGILTRLFKRDELKIIKKDVQSYWIDVEHRNKNIDFFKAQY